MTERRFLLKNDKWRDTFVTGCTIKQWFVKWTDDIQDVIEISRTGDHSHGMHGTHRVCMKGVSSSTTVQDSMVEFLYESKVGCLKNCYFIRDCVRVDQFENNDNTTLLIIDCDLDELPTSYTEWIGQEVTDHSFYKNDYLISVR